MVTSKIEVTSGNLGRSSCLQKKEKTAMIARLKLKPGQKGTKRLHAEHGDALVCVRYRYDEASSTRIKTVELIVEKKSWHPRARKFADNELVPVQIGFSEKELMNAARTAKGRWDPDVRLWFIRYGKIRGTALEKHMILDAFPNKEKGKSI